MRESENVEAVADVPEHILDELAHTLADKLDILLDRLTDRALGVPDTATPAWRAQWQARQPDTERRQNARRRYVRAVIATRAGIALHDTPPAPVAPQHTATPAKIAPRTRPRRPLDENQLLMF